MTSSLLEQIFITSNNFKIFLIMIYDYKLWWKRRRILLTTCRNTLTRFGSVWPLIRSRAALPMFITELNKLDAIVQSLLSFKVTKNLKQIKQILWFINQCIAIVCYRWTFYTSNQKQQNNKHNVITDSVIIQIMNKNKMKLVSTSSLNA